MGIPGARPVSALLRSAHMRAMTKSLPSPGSNPSLDNRLRRDERKLDRLVRSAFRVRTPRGRRRKKELTTTGRTDYKDLVVAVARHLKARSN